MNIKLIAMDLDGTALQADRCSFSPRLNAALDAAFAQGVAVVPVTGRQYDLLPPAVLGHPKWSGLCVLCNGGQIRELETGELLYGLYIPKTALLQLQDLAARLDIPLEFSRNGHLHLTKESYKAQLPHENLNFHVHTILAKSGVIVDSLLPLCEEGIIEKAQLPHIPGHLHREVEEALKTIDVSAVWSSGSSMEITHSRATKGNAIEQLSRLLDIPVENILALGDSGNDETMLRRAGLGVAMGNAPDFVKAAADAVTDTNANDGAAAAIEHFVLHIN